MAAKVLLLVAVAFAAVSVVLSSTDGKTLEGYKFGSDVQKYVDLGLDACDVSNAVSATPAKFSDAKNIYEKGKNAVKSGGYTATLKTFATSDFSGEKYFSMYSKWFGKDPAWLDTFIQEAFRGTGDFADFGEVGRAQGVEKTAKDSIMISLTLHELDAVQNAMVNKNYDDKKGAPHYFDEAFGVYAGNPTCGPYNLANKYAPLFGTIKDCATNSSVINHNTVNAFVAGRAAAKKGDAAAVKDAIDEIVRNIIMARMQAVLKYAAELDELVAAKKDTEEAQTEGYTYYRTIAPLIADKNPEAAAAIYKLLDLPNAPKATTNFTKQITSYFQAVYKDYGIREDDIGKYGTTSETSSCPKPTNSAASVSASMAVVGAVVGAAAMLL